MIGRARRAMDAGVEEEYWDFILGFLVGDFSLAVSEGSRRS